MGRYSKFFLLFLVAIEIVHSEYQFPENFSFGVSTSAYQTEGGWNASGKGENIWDRMTHINPEMIADRTTADVACDSFHLWKTDVEMLKRMGVNYYRFSLSWSRILPSGFSNEINPDGLNYYNQLINSLIENGIEPMVTLYHWDLPQKIQDLGGWTNMKTADYFAEYARIVFREFGDRVKTWITINEPSNICETPYGENDGAPNIYSPGIGDYLCGKTVLIAHSKAFKIYDREFRFEQQGKIGISIYSKWAEPRTDKQEDVEAAEREMQMTFGWWAHPIFSKEGDYPSIMKSRILERSLSENFIESRLPNFTESEIADLKGSSDFFGLNHYDTYLINNYEYPIGEPSFKKDKGTDCYQDPNWKPNVNIVPWGFYKLIRWISNEYGNPPIIVTENGYFDDGSLQDLDRMTYYTEFLKSLLRAMKEGSNVQSYTAWSLMDNMEWTHGYTMKYGLYHVDFNSPNRTRTPKASSFFFTELIRTKKIPDNLEKFLLQF